MEDLLKKGNKKVTDQVQEKVMESFAMVNEAETISDLINNSYFKGKLRVVELEVYEEVELRRKFIIEGEVGNSEEKQINLLKIGIKEQLTNFYGKQKTEKIFDEIWRVEMNCFTIGDELPEMELFNVKGQRESIKSFEKEICLFEFWDCNTLGLSVEEKSLTVVNSYQAFKRAGLKEKKIINYIGIANTKKYKTWMEILKSFEIMNNGENMFQFTQPSIAENLGITDFPYFVITDTRGKIKYSGSPSNIDVKEFLLNLYEESQPKSDHSNGNKSNGCDSHNDDYNVKKEMESGENMNTKLKENLNDNCKSCKCGRHHKITGNYNSLSRFTNKEEINDPVPSWSKLDEEIRLGIVMDANDRLVNLGIFKTKFKVWRNVYYDYKNIHYYTKICFKGFADENQKELIHAIIFDLKDMWGFEKIDVDVSSESNMTKMLGLMGLMSALESK